MIKLEYPLSDFESIYDTDEGFFFSPDIIVDNELMNDISDDWNYKKGKISVVGMLFLNQITVFVAEKEDDKEFKQAVADELFVRGKNSFIYSFNRNMEMGNFQGDFGIEIPINEIKPFNAKGWNKNRFFHELQKREVIPKIDLKDVYDGDSSKAVESWQKYLESDDEKHLMDIVSHNINCLLKECIILKNQKYFREHWVIDEKGFMLREK